MNFLFFDTETTGLPLRWNAPMTEVTNWPRVIQLAWMLTNEHGIELNRECQLVYPDGWVVPNGQFWQDNGFTQERNALQGLPIAELLDKFILDLAETDFLVSHNMAFDHNVLGAEMIRSNNRGKVALKICTKESSTEYCKLPGVKGWKWPKLQELHRILFDADFEGAHDALADVIACKDCFFRLLKLKVITLPEFNKLKS